MPSIAQAIVAPEDEPGGKVQGHASGFGDITLHSGANFTVELGATVQSVSLDRSIDQSSSLTVTVYDPDRKVLSGTLLAQKLDLELDGLWFRLVAVSKQGKVLTLTFEDRDIALLRELKGPKKAFRARMTRAEFVLSLVREVKPSIGFYCPELHVHQPVVNHRQAKTLKTQKSATRQPGLSRQDLGHITVKHAKASLQQIGYINTVLDTGMSMGAPLKVLIASIMTITQESDVSNLNGSGGYGLFSQLRNGAWPASRDPAKDAHGFFKVAIAKSKADPKLSLNDLCQAVQASGVPNAYGQWEKEATATVNEYLGGAAVGGSITETVNQPYIFQVKKGENYWAAIQRLAAEVNWRAFMCAGKLFFISETELSKGQVRMAIDPDTPGIDNVDFDYHMNKKVTEATVAAWIKDWMAPPGSVATLKGYGPASLGSGDAPSGKPGISSNQVAATGEGRGRYIVSAISSNLRREGPSPADQATVTLKKPMKPLPEPAAPTTTNTLSVGDGAIGGGALEMVKWAKSVLGTKEGSTLQKRWATRLGYGPSLPWCSIFIAYGLKFIVGLTDLPSDPAYSGSWLHWSGGKRISKTDLQAGDLIIYDWGDGGRTDHVALYIGNGKKIGGNQAGGAVTQDSADFGSAVGFVRPNYT